MAPVRTPGPVDAPLAIPELQVAGYQGLALRVGFTVCKHGLYCIWDNVNHNREVVNSIRVRWLTLYQPFTLRYKFPFTTSLLDRPNLYPVQSIVNRNLRYSRLSTGVATCLEHSPVQTLYG